MHEAQANELLLVLVNSLARRASWKKDVHENTVFRGFYASRLFFHSDLTYRR